MIQSENPGLRSSLKAFDKENAHSNLPVSKAAMNVPVKHQLLQPASTRKALGNITNISNSSKQEVPSADKKNSVLLPPRRALGDITNSAAPSKKLPLPTPEIVKPKLNAVTTADPRPSARASATMLRAEQFALDDIERSAGKTWTQLESERHQEQENTINQRVKQLTTATLAALRTPMDVMVGVCIPGYQLDSSTDPPIPHAGGLFMQERRWHQGGRGRHGSLTRGRRQAPPEDGRCAALCHEISDVLLYCIRGTVLGKSAFDCLAPMPQSLSTAFHLILLDHQGDLRPAPPHTLPTPSSHTSHPSSRQYTPSFLTTRET